MSPPTFCVKFCFYTLPSINVQHLKIYRITQKVSKTRNTPRCRTVFLNVCVCSQKFSETSPCGDVDWDKQEILTQCFCKRIGQEAGKKTLQGFCREIRDKNSFLRLNREEQNKCLDLGVPGCELFPSLDSFASYYYMRKRNPASLWCGYLCNNKLINCLNGIWYTEISIDPISDGKEMKKVFLFFYMDSGLLKKEYLSALLHRFVFCLFVCLFSGQ